MSLTTIEVKLGLVRHVYEGSRFDMCHFGVNIA